MQVTFIPENQLTFTYVPNKHLITTLKIQNKNSFPIVYKFKASSMNRFVIRPNQGMLKPSQSIDIQIVFHKQGVQNYQNQKLQIVYGKSFQQAQNKLYTLFVDNYSKNDRLNLTMMVEEKAQRVKILQKQVKQIQSMPKTGSLSSTASIGGKSSKIGIKQIIIVLLIGFICGFFAPVRLFRKDGLLSFIVQAPIDIQNSQN